MGSRQRRDGAVLSPPHEKQPVSPSIAMLSYCTAALAAVAAGAGVLGWAFGVEELRRVIPGMPLMRFNTALCLLLLALAWFLPRPLRYACAGAGSLIAFVTVLEYATSTNLGIDQLFVDDPSTAAVNPGRIALSTSISIVLLGTGIILAAIGERWAAQACVLITLLLGFLTLLGYAYDVPAIYSSRQLSTVAVPTAAALLLLSVAVLAAVPQGALHWAARGPDAAAILVRRLLPAAVIGLPLVGLFARLGQQADWYSSGMTLAITSVAGALVVAVVTWAAAHRLARADRYRAQAMGELTELKVDLERQVKERAAQLQQRGSEIAVLQDRQRIAADLHDIVIQRLFAAGMFLQGGAAQIVDAGARRRMDTAVEAMDAAIKDLRASIFDLGGKRQLRADLTTAVDDVCNEAARVLGFTPELIVDDPHLDAELARDDLLAVLREALSNVAKHAQATRVAVVVRSLHGVVSLTVTDDGLGMNPAGYRSGTRNMAERAWEYGGDCLWDAVEPRGTRVHWQVPAQTTVDP